MSGAHAIVVGGGIFGLAAATTLARRGWRVTMVESGEIPNSLAASTDVSKVVRMEYGTDQQYMALGEQAIAGWHEWNSAWVAEGREPLYHETGVAMLCLRGMGSGGFEGDSFELLRKRGHEPVRLRAGDIAARFPAWSTGRYVDGFFHAKGGYVESGRVLIELARALRQNPRVTLLEGVRVQSLVEKSGCTVGVSLDDARSIGGDVVVVAAGAWTAKLVPDLQETVKPTGHPVFHLRPKDPALFAPERFPTFTADVARTGYYGFPLNRDGVVKIGVHAVGVDIDADAPRVTSAEDEDRLADFLEITFPALRDAPIVYRRLCLYADTPGEDFVIARHPDDPGVVVASGGSGHGFKFGPVLGRLIADVVEGEPSVIQNAYGEKFAWRRTIEHGDDIGAEAARCHDPIEFKK